MNKHRIIKGLTAAALAAALAFGSPALPETITGLSGLVIDAEAASSDFTIDKNGTITGYKGKGGKVNIPSKINGITVKKIGDEAFYAFSNSNAKKITSITIPNTVTEIGDHAFSYIDNITSITIPDSVKTIGKSCFSSCYKLSSVKLSKNIKKIGKCMFEECASLKKITIPSSVTELGEEAFYKSGLTEITIPDSVNTICSECFKNCTKLKKIHLGKNLRRIEFLVFDGCKSLETIHIPASVYHIGETNFIRGNDMGLGHDMLSLKEITVDKDSWDFISIDGVLMQKNRILAEDEYSEETMEYEIIQIPLCLNKKTYNIPEGVTSIRMYAYSNFVSSSVYYDYTKDRYNEKEKEKDEKEQYKRCKIKYLTIPGSVKTIPSSAFQYTALETVTIGEGVTTIGGGAFDNCKYLKTVKLPSTLTEISDHAFSGCENLTSIKLPNNLTSIGTGAFTRCEKLTNITLPNNLTSIEYATFSGCKSLKTITIPKNIKSVDKTAFDNCPNLKIKYKGKTYTVEAFKKLPIITSKY